MAATPKDNSPRSVVGILTVVIFICGLIIYWAIPWPDVCTREQRGDQNLLTLNDIEPFENKIHMIGHLGGKASSIFINKNTAFIKFGLELAALDISEPDKIKRMGYMIVPGDLIYVDENQEYAYINYEGLWRVDISDLTKMSAIQLSTIKGNSIKIVNNHAYITSRNCTHMTIIEGSIDIACKNSLHIINTSSAQSSPACIGGLPGDIMKAILSGSAPELIDPPTNTKVKGISYVVSKYDGLEIYATSIAGEFVKIGSYSPPPKLSSIVVYDSNAFITTINDENSQISYGLNLFDISDPSNPTDLGKLPFHPVFLGTFEHFAFVKPSFSLDDSDAEVQMFDMQRPFSPENATTPAALSMTQNMAIVGNRIFSTLKYNKIRTVDFSNMFEPVVLSEIPLGAPDQLNYGISIENNMAYIIVRDEGLRIMDISNELAPYQAGSYPMAQTIPVDLIVKDGIAYIAEWYGSLEIVDVSDFQFAHLIGTYDAHGRMHDMILMNNLIFATTGSDGLQVIDVSNPRSPRLVGSYITGSFISGLDVQCPYIYLTDVDNGLFILQTDLLLAEDCR